MSRVGFEPVVPTFECPSDEERSLGSDPTPKRRPIRFIFVLTFVTSRFAIRFWLTLTLRNKTFPVNLLTSRVCKITKSCNSYLHILVVMNSYTPMWSWDVCQVVRKRTFQVQLMLIPCWLFPQHW